MICVLPDLAIIKENDTIMKWGTLSLQTRLYLLTAVILVVGLGCACLVYFTAGQPSDNTMIQDFENSKRYVHDLELYGGKLNVLVDQFRRWFDGLWHGKSLALTIACITVFVSLGLSLVAYLLGSNSGGGSDRSGENI